MGEIYYLKQLNNFAKFTLFIYFIETWIKCIEYIYPSCKIIIIIKSLNYEYNLRLYKIGLVSHNKNQKDINMNANNILLNDEHNRLRKKKNVVI